MDPFRILLWPDPKLKMESLVVLQPPSPDFVERMRITMEGAGGVGLSAIQVGFPVRVVVAKIQRTFRVFVNPEWAPVPDTKAEPMLEGCLSTPGQYETVYRYPKVTVTFNHDSTLEICTETFEGLWAQMIQHECEHLDGKMFTDHLKRADRSRIMGEMLKLKRSGTK